MYTYIRTYIHTPYTHTNTYIHIFIYTIYIHTHTYTLTQTETYPRPPTTMFSAKLEMREINTPAAKQ